MVTRRSYCVACILALAIAPEATPATPDYHVVRMTQPQPNGLGQDVSPAHLPVQAVFAPGVTDKMFIVQLGGQNSGGVDHGADGDVITKRDGRLVLFDTNTRLVDYNSPFLVIPDTNTSNPFAADEIGLFSLAFHPDYQTNGKFYVNVAVNHAGQAPVVDTRLSPFKTSVREYIAVNPADPSQGAVFSKTILELDQPAANHNGSWLGFNPFESAEGKNYLYITQGDGGDQHDPARYGQNKESWFGTVMRVDIDGDDFADPDLNYAVPTDNPFYGGASANDDEVFAYGLRNPWRASFDSLTGDMYIGDVGQGTWEEVNVIPYGTSGQNFGWRLREGFGPTPTGGVGGSQPADGVDPILAYLHGFGSYQGNSITGGIVYRGPVVSLRGKYLFADAVSGGIWAIDLEDVPNFDPNAPSATMMRLNSTFNPDFGSIVSIVGFGEDPEGNLLMVDYLGDIFRLEPGLLQGDFNGDNKVDAADYTVWRDGLGGPVFRPEDYYLWRDHYGEMGIEFIVSAPEPCGAWLVGLCGCLCLGRTRRGVSSFSMFRGCSDDTVRSRRGEEHFDGLRRIAKVRQTRVARSLGSLR
ncbi:MAG: PQQ-dependent sugar dehydrogenase [Planctomycetales bacterium]|nr:PQQ-dependent sugar dehydrogenase [Planctomycetales bacterium]